MRQGALGQFLLATYTFFSMQPPPLISIVTEGEIRSLARRLKWGHRKLRELNILLDALTIVPLPFLNVVDAYAVIDEHGIRNGLALSKNDL